MVSGQLSHVGSPIPTWVLFDAYFTVTCDSWELEFLAGLGAAYRHNFRTGESDISILVGAQARLFEVGRVSAGVEVKGGLRCGL